MEIGGPNKTSHYCVQGIATRFYVWVRETSIEPGGQYASGWIKGDAAFDHYYKLQELYNYHSKQEWVDYLKMLKEEFKYEV